MGQIASADQATTAFAGFWRRFAALLLDGLIVGVVFGALVIGLRGTGYVIGWVGGLGYFVVLEGGPSGQTLGKRVLGIRVSDLDTGAPIGYGRAAIRFFGRILSTIPLDLGYLCVLWDRRHQAWHDKLADDVVMRTGVVPSAAPSANWYADPHRHARLRYWDGTRWTEHTSD